MTEGSSCEARLPSLSVSVLGHNIPVVPVESNLCACRCLRLGWGLSLFRSGGGRDGDGKPDLVVLNGGSNTVGLLLGNGDGTFQAVVTYGSGGVYPQSVAVADVNEDGKPDLVV